jgi:protein O-mannosyl-transferase
MTRCLAALRPHIALLFILLLTGFIYLPSLSGGFVVDDVPTIQNNPYLADSSHIPRFFSHGVWANSALANDNVPIYRPLFLLTEWLNHHLWGHSPTGYHVVSILLHLLNVGLVYALIRSLLNVGNLPAALGAAVFALHPARVESVAWMSGITDPLVACFLMLALLAHRAFVTRDQHWRYAVQALLCLQLALWNKELAIAFPLLVLAHDWLYQRKIHWPIWAGYTALTALFLAARAAALSAASQPALNFSALSRSADFLLGYGEMLLLPTHLPFYLQPPEHAVSSVLGGISALLLITLVVSAWRSIALEKRPALWFTASWFVLLSWPLLLMAMYQQGYYAARFLYVPAIGFSLLIALLCGHILQHHARFKTTLLAAFALILAIYGGLTWRDIPRWHSEQTIYTSIAQDAPESSAGFIGLGHFYLEQGNVEAAEKNFLLGLKNAKIRPAKVEALVALGTIFGMKNQLPQSAVYFKAAVQIDPNHSEAWSGLGNLAWMQGQMNEAITHYEQALAARPDNYEAAVNLARAYAQTGQRERAASVQQRVLRMPQ